MTRHVVGVVVGVVIWFALGMLGGFVLRESWPAYAQVVEGLTFAREAQPPAFTFPMLVARLVMGAIATIGMGFVTARITPLTTVRLIPAVLLLIFFIVEHTAVWHKFPLWYHLTFLVPFLPLAYLGGWLAQRSRLPAASPA